MDANTAAYVTQAGLTFQIGLKCLTVCLRDYYCFYQILFLIRSIRPALSVVILCIILKLASLFSYFVFSPGTAANMWFHLSSSEIRVERNGLMVISLSLPLFLLSLLTMAGLDERTWIFCFSFRFRCPKKKLQMWAARHTYTKMLDWKKHKNQAVQTKRGAKRSAAPSLFFVHTSSLHDLFMVLFSKRDCTCRSAPLAGCWTQQISRAEDTLVSPPLKFVHVSLPTTSTSQARNEVVKVKHHLCGLHRYGIPRCANMLSQHGQAISRETTLDTSVISVLTTSSAFYWSHRGSGAVFRVVGQRIPLCSGLCLSSPLLHAGCLWAMETQSYICVSHHSSRSKDLENFWNNQPKEWLRCGI